MVIDRTLCFNLRYIKHSMLYVSRGSSWLEMCILLHNSILHSPLGLSDLLLTFLFPLPSSKQHSGRETGCNVTCAFPRTEIAKLLLLWLCKMFIRWEGWRQTVQRLAKCLRKGQKEYTTEKKPQQTHNQTSLSSFKNLKGTSGCHLAVLDVLCSVYSILFPN